MVETRHAAIDELEFALAALERDSPSLFANGIFLAGESYGAQWTTLLADRYLQPMRESSPKVLGLLIGNGLIDPAVQRKAVAEKLRWTGVLAPGTKQVKFLFFFSLSLVFSTFHSQSINSSKRPISWTAFATRVRTTTLPSRATAFSSLPRRSAARRSRSTTTSTGASRTRVCASGSF